MNHKLIFVLLDGLTYESAALNMGFLHALCEEKIGKFYKLKSCLPSMSRPLYECLLTGVRPALSGVLNNDFCVSKELSIFELLKKEGLRSAVAAYYWVYELYNKTRFIPHLHRHVNDESLNISCAHFYYEDSYPDSHVFCDAESLRLKKDPHFLFIHSMNIDDIGHKFGSQSFEYKNISKKADNILSKYLNKWLEEGYNIIITSDHGMGAEKSHSGLSEAETELGLFVFGKAFSFKDLKIKQDELCGTMCELLGLKYEKNANLGLLR